ncbi:MAG: metallophosphoesterase [Oscillospiraceae bacterium]|nr:metallophosphoesterase [Oscillospiraceae bacterium]
MAVFVLSDPHLSFGYNKPMDIFGSRWENHEKKIEQGWEKAGITDDDIIVIPGDISWALKLEDTHADFLFLNNLKGLKVIGRGNHDLWWTTDTKVKKMFWENSIKTIKLLHNNALDAGEYIICGTRGWYYDEKNAPADIDYNKIINREMIRLVLSFNSRLKFNKDAETIVFMHFPPVFKDYVCAELIDVLKKHGIRRCFYGHIHSAYDIPSVFEHEGILFEIVSADYLNFVPIKI